MEFLIKLFFGLVIGVLSLFFLTCIFMMLDNFIPPKVALLTNAQLAEKVTKSFNCHLSFYDQKLQVKIKSISINSRTINYEKSSFTPNMAEHVGSSPVRDFMGNFTIESLGGIAPKPIDSVIVFDGKERLIGDERKIVSLKTESTAGIQTRMDIIPNCLF